MKWDTKLDADFLNEWKGISTQANSGVHLSVPRYIGEYAGAFPLVTFAEASKDFIGAVMCLFGNDTGSLRFIRSKNRLISKATKTKTIPVLELLAI